LGFYNHSDSGPPPDELVQELLGQRPTQWRWENDDERQERWEAEKREEIGSRGQTAVWSAKYRHLRLGHTAVVHKKSDKRGRQFVAMRRVKLCPEDIAELIRSGTD
jgi:hypothetical protein